MCCITIDHRASVGPDLDFVFGDVRKRNACDSLMTFQEFDLVVLDEELQCLHKGIGFAGSGTRFQPKALTAFKASKHCG